MTISFSCDCCNGPCCSDSIPPRDLFFRWTTWHGTILKPNPGYPFNGLPEYIPAEPCPCMDIDGDWFTLTWDEDEEWWSGSVDICETSLTIYLRCHNFGGAPLNPTLPHHEFEIIIVPCDASDPETGVFGGFGEWYSQPATTCNPFYMWGGHLLQSTPYATCYGCSLYDYVAWEINDVGGGMPFMMPEPTTKKLNKPRKPCRGCGKPNINGILPHQSRTPNRQIGNGSKRVRTDEPDANGNQGG